MLTGRCLALILCAGILGCTWAAHPTAATARVTDSKFKEAITQEDRNQTTSHPPTSVADTLQTTEVTRSPKSEEEKDLPDLESEDDLLLAFQKQMQALERKRQTTPVVPKRQCGRRLARNARIVGGKDSYEGEFPWAVSVRLLTTHSCGGTIINRYWILTAAHCVKRYSARYFKVRTGENNINVDGFRHDLDIQVGEMSIHPNFGKPRRYSNDLALLKLKKPIKFNTFAQPICLPDPDEDYAGRNATAVGWGSMEESEKVKPSKLQKVLVPVLNNSICAKWYAEVYNGYVRIYDYQICAGYKEGGKDACQGDSGGPLVIKEGEHYTLVGITSAGVGCARKQLPGLYSRVSLFVPWIQRVTGV